MPNRKAKERKQSKKKRRVAVKNYKRMKKGRSTNVKY